jgi:NAD(P)H-dependent flavin oxidoreductase YrpB (nitropropane dioxygenase family)
VVRYASTSPKAEFDGDVEATSMWAGQSAGLVSEIRPAGEVVRQLAEEAAAALRGSVGLIRD